MLEITSRSSSRSIHHIFILLVSSSSNYHQIIDLSSQNQLMFPGIPYWPPSTFDRSLSLAFMSDLVLSVPWLRAFGETPCRCHSIGDVIFSRRQFKPYIEPVMGLYMSWEGCIITQPAPELVRKFSPKLLALFLSFLASYKASKVSLGRELRWEKER